MKQKTTKPGITREVISIRVDRTTARLVDELRGKDNRSLYLAELLARVLPQEAIYKHLLGK